jgi:DNA primase
VAPQSILPPALKNPPLTFQLKNLDATHPFPAAELGGEEEKYKLPPSFVKSAVLFNLHRCLVLAREKGLILVEGFFSVFWLHQHGVSNVVALMGSSLSEHQLQLLVSTLGPDGRVALLFDQDDAGRQCLTQCIEALTPRLYVKALHLPEGVPQPDVLSLKQIHQLFTGDQ